MNIIIIFAESSSTIFLTFNIQVSFTPGAASYNRSLICWSLSSPTGPVEV